MMIGAYIHSRENMKKFQAPKWREQNKKYRETEIEVRRE
jgi:hypothetical protein